MSAQAPPIQVPQPKRRFGRSIEGRTRERLEGVLFALPAIVVLAAFVVYPAYYTIRLAFYNSDYLFGFTGWVGLDNFKDLLTNSPDFLDLSHFPPEGALINNVKWIFLYISFCLVLGLGLAVLTIRVRYERVVKSIIFVPMAISATAVGVIWLLVYSPDPNIGTLNAVIHGVAGTRFRGSASRRRSTTRSSPRTSGRPRASPWLSSPPLSRESRRRSSKPRASMAQGSGPFSVASCCRS